MLGKIARKVFGTPNDRKIKTTRPLVEKINALEPEFEKLDDAGLIAKTAEFKERVAKGESLDHILPEAFANCREAARRALALRAFDVQLMGGILLQQGNISEMKTGEGKTLVATFPAYLNALTGRGVHIVTVNDYLATRDAEWMSKVYNALGMTCGTVYPRQPEDEKAQAYACDITYATNNELGFDYLRDNMKSELNQIHQRDHYYAIVDEVDSILIDEARTPLIISGPSEDRSELYISVDKLIPALVEEHYEVDEKTRNVTFTDEGNEYLEEHLHARGLLPEGQTLYDPESTTVVHHVNQAIRAHKLFQKDKDYIVRDGDVVLVDEFTGTADEVLIETVRDKDFVRADMTGDGEADFSIMVRNDAASPDGTISPSSGAAGPKSSQSPRHSAASKPALAARLRVSATSGPERPGSACMRKMFTVLDGKRSLPGRSCDWSTEWRANGSVIFSRSPATGAPDHRP